MCSSDLAIGLILSGFGTGGILFNLFVRHIVRRIRPRLMVTLGGFTCGGSIFAVSQIGDWHAAFPLMIGIGLGFYLLHNVLQTRSTEAAPGARGVGVSLFGISWTMGQGLGVAVMGAGVSAFGFTPMMAAYGLGLVALGLWMRFNFHRLP